MIKPRANPAAHTKHQATNPKPIKSLVLAAWPHSGARSALFRQQVRPQQPGENRGAGLRAARCARSRTGARRKVKLPVFCRIFSLARGPRRR